MKEIGNPRFSRRGFIRGAGVAALGFTLLPARFAWAKTAKLAIALEKAAPLKEVGGSVMLKLKGRDVLFVRESETTVRAVNPTCTHKKCTVEYKADLKRLACPCHKSAFALDGTVLDGPAPAPLETFKTKLQSAKERVLVALPEGA